MCFSSAYFFFFNDTATTEIYTLSLHDALPISGTRASAKPACSSDCHSARGEPPASIDRKSTRLNSSHANISYAVFCLKKKKKSIEYSRPLPRPQLQRSSEAAGSEYLPYQRDIR